MKRNPRLPKKHMSAKGPNPNKPGYTNDGRFIGKEAWDKAMKSSARGGGCVALFFLLFALVITGGFLYEAYGPKKPSGKIPTPRQQTERILGEIKEHYETNRKVVRGKRQNLLLRNLEGKYFGDWARGLERYGIRYKKYTAAFYRDLADSTHLQASYAEQDRFLQTYGLTRAHIREVKKKYKK